MTEHEYNIQAFHDTMDWCRTNEKLAAAIRQSEKDTSFVNERDEIQSFENQELFKQKADVIVSSRRSFEAAASYEGRRVCVLNFASAVHPGGGVAWGSNAQEESLCRISTLYPCLDTKAAYEHFYNPHHKEQNPPFLNNDDCIFTPGILVIKTDDVRMNRLMEDHWSTVDVITCAAPDLRGGRISETKLFNLHVRRMKRILDLACMHKEEVMILGAFGCGAFGNDPRIVSSAMKKAQEGYLHCFRTIEYAVYCPPGRDENYQIFHDQFEQGE